MAFPLVPEFVLERAPVPERARVLARAPERVLARELARELAPAMGRAGGGEPLLAGRPRPRRLPYLPELLQQGRLRTAPRQASPESRLACLPPVLPRAAIQEQGLVLARVLARERERANFLPHLLRQLPIAHPVGHFWRAAP